MHVSAARRIYTKPLCPAGLLVVLVGVFALLVGGGCEQPPLGDDAPPAEGTPAEHNTAAHDVAARDTAKQEPVEVRGVWLTNVDSEVLNSRASIAEAMQFLADHHFNVVFPVVWNNAHTLYPSAVMDTLTGVPIDPAFAGRDPLAEVIVEAHQRGIAVIPWFEFGFAASYQAGGGPILDKHPQWAAKDADGNLLTKNGFEWMNAYHPAVQNLLRQLVFEVIRNYDVDGVQGDDRLPAQPVEGGYSAYTDSLYRAAHGGAAPPSNARDSTWKRWRADQLNAFGRRLYNDVKAMDEDLIVSWSPSAYVFSYDEYLQDWPAWISEGYADMVHPQAYRYSLDEYVATLDAQHPAAVGIDSAYQRLMYPGMLIKVGDYRVSSDYLVEAIEANRARGFEGEVLFFYEGLRENDNALADTLRATVYRQPARLPFTPAGMRDLDGASK